MSYFNQDDLRFCLCGCGKKIPSYDKKGRSRFYINGHNRRRPRKLSKYRGIASNLDKERLEEIIEILSSLLERFIGANTTASQLALIVHQEEVIKALRQSYDESLSKNLELDRVFDTILSKYIKMDQLDLEDEKSVVKQIGGRARGVVVNEEKYDKVYQPEILKEFRRMLEE